MNNAKFFLMVRFSIEAQAEAQLKQWLDGGHVAEVLRQPGFLWCRRIKLQAGGYMMMYGIESRAAFEAYEANSAIKTKFLRERAAFDQYMRIERFTGDVEASYAA
jgi:hypothetical protein